MRQRGISIEPKMFVCYLFFHSLYWLQHKSNTAFPFMKSMPSSKLRTELKIQLSLNVETRNTATDIYRGFCSLNTPAQVLNSRDGFRWQGTSAFNRWKGRGSRGMWGAGMALHRSQLDVNVSSVFQLLLLFTESQRVAHHTIQPYPLPADG